MNECVGCVETGCGSVYMMMDCLVGHWLASDSYWDL